MVITDVNQVVYQGDGATTAFPFTFRIIDATDVKLLLIDEDGTETDIASDYFVDINTNTVHYPGYAPGSEPAEADQPAPIQTGQRLVVYRELPVTQEKDLGEKWPFFVIELVLDKLTMLIQQVKGIWDRCLKVSVGLGATAPDFNYTVPIEAGKTFRVKDDGTGFELTEDPAVAHAAAVAAQEAAERAQGAAETAQRKAEDAQEDSEAAKDAAEAIASQIDIMARALVYDSVAAIKADISLAEGQTAATKGYHTVNDGRSAVYTIRAKTAGDVDDGVFTIFLNNGNVAEKITSEKQDIVRFLFPKTETKAEWQNPDIARQGDCQIIVTPSGKTLMIDASTTYQYDNLMSYMQAKGVTKIDYFLLTHYHGDHYGNIENFLNQDIVDFSHTHWFLPKIIDVDGGLTLGAMVKGWLDAKNADYEYLDDDKTVQLDKTVSMFLFNCTDEARQYELDNLLVESGANAFSVQALIYHHNVVAYYTGDLWAQGINYVVNNYDLPNVDLMKLNHHGLYAGKDVETHDTNTGGCKTVYMRKLTPKYSVYNCAEVGWNFARNNIVDFACQYGEVYQILDDAEFISDGKILRKITDNRYRANVFSEDESAIYIDANYDFSNGISDGTKDRPFKDFNEAKAYMGNGLSRRIVIFFAAGNYGSIDLSYIPKPVRLEFSHNNDTIFDVVTIEKCAKVTLLYELHCNSIVVTDSNVDSPSLVFLSPTTTAISFTRSKVAFDAKVSLDGSNAAMTGNYLINITKSEVYFVTLEMSNSSTKTCIRAAHNSSVGIYNLILNNITATYVIRGFEGGSKVYITQVPTLTDCSFYALSAKQQELDFVSTRASRIKTGTTAERPDKIYIGFGFLYFDKTINKLIMLSDGNVWVDATTGTGV